MIIKERKIDTIFLISILIKGSLIINHNSISFHLLIEEKYYNSSKSVPKTLIILRNRFFLLLGVRSSKSLIYTFSFLTRAFP